MSRKEKPVPPAESDEWAWIETEEGTHRKTGPRDLEAAERDAKVHRTHMMGTVWRTVGERHEKWASWCGVLLCASSSDPKRVTCPECIQRINMGLGASDLSQPADLPLAGEAAHIGRTA